MTTFPKGTFGLAERPDENSSSEVLIRAHPFLQGLPDAVLRALAANAMLVRYSPGEWIFRAGDPANRFYLIRSGKVALESPGPSGHGALIQSIGPGDVLGWSWLLAPFVWQFDARATEPVEAIFFYGTRLREECEQDNHLGYELLKRMASVVIQRLQATRQRLGEALRPEKSTTRTD
jgi:CRP-like cAMP-binding protein